ncbi:hypothetical protein [Nostoc sp. DSM 114167]
MKKQVGSRDNKAIAPTKQRRSPSTAVMLPLPINSFGRSING